MATTLKLNGSGKRPTPAPVESAPKTETRITADVVQLALRVRFNPLRNLSPQLLTAQLDNFWLGWVAFAAFTWDAIERRDDTLRNVIAKRKKAVARLQRESLQREESDEAAAHAQALDEFYDNMTVVNALNENERGGLQLLLRQMMDAVGKYYAVHEIVWQPAGPNGDSDALTAEVRFVPLWFFENRTGKLRFLPVPLGGSEGEDLEDGGWMVTTGDGLMEACSVAYMFKNLPLKDWLSYSDKFGTPGVLGQTDAARGSDAGNAIRDAVAAFGQNWSGVVYGANGSIKEPISLVTAKGEGELPFPKLIERMDRAMASLWRGSDLSTMSADTKGASVQEGESEILLDDDAAMLSGTLNHYIDRWVIYQKFGTWEGKAYSRIVVPQPQNVELDLKIDDFLLKAGARMGERERLEHYGRAIMDPKDTPLHNPATVTERVNDNQQGQPVPVGDLPNERLDEDAPVVGKLMATARDLFAKSTADDLAPLRQAIAECLQGDEAGLLDRARVLYAALPKLADKIIASEDNAATLYRILSAALASGLSTDPTESK